MAMYYVAVLASYVGSVDIEASSPEEAKEMVEKGLETGDIRVELEFSNYEEIAHPELLEDMF